MSISERNIPTDVIPNNYTQRVRYKGFDSMKGTPIRFPWKRDLPTNCPKIVSLSLIALSTIPGAFAKSAFILRPKETHKSGQNCYLSRSAIRETSMYAPM